MTIGEELALDKLHPLYSETLSAAEQKRTDELTNGCFATFVRHKPLKREPKRPPTPPAEPSSTPDNTQVED